MATQQAHRPFRSILGDSARMVSSQSPDYFRDLNLDQVVEALLSGFEEYDLAAFYWTPLEDESVISYRQDVFRDLEQEAVLDEVRSFSEAMRTMRGCLGKAGEERYVPSRQRWFVEAVLTYCRAVEALVRGLESDDLGSAGLLALCRWLADYAASPTFITLRDGAEEVIRSLSDVSYTLRIDGPRISVRRYEEAPDYAREVMTTFERFRQTPQDEALPNSIDKFHERADHIDAAIVDMVAKLFPEAFALLAQFCATNTDYLEATIRRFDREVQFYLAYIELMAGATADELAFCYPEVTESADGLFAHNAFDLALALKLREEGGIIVANGFSLRGEEKVLVVSGPNQGGKTTFARMVGQLHHLACLGCPVPAASARLLLFDHLFTHFEREERLLDLRGKLEDDLRRIQRILLNTTSSSLIIVNEIFTSTTFDDASYLSGELLDKIIEIGAVCVIVSFIDELATLGPATVSMVSMVDPSEPTKRTYQVVRAAPNGLAYAAAVAEKHGLSYQLLRRRLNP